MTLHEELVKEAEEKRESERRNEVELMVAQISDALMRAGRRNFAIEKGSKTLSDQLEALSELVGTEQPEGDQEEAYSA